MRLQTIQDCDRELEAIAQAEAEARGRGAIGEQQLRRLTIRRGEVLARRIDLQHGDLFAAIEGKGRFA
jgi:hypothetical protein